MSKGEKECPRCGVWFEFEETQISGGFGTSPWDGPPRCSLCQIIVDTQKEEIRSRPKYEQPVLAANPYYAPEKCGLEIIGSLDELGLSYEYNILVFWFRPETKEVLCISDSGCSCPTPFGDYPNGVGLETIGSLKDARNAMASWLTGCSIRPPSGEIEDLRTKLKAYLK